MNQNEKFEQVIQKIYPQSTLLQTWNLIGGVSVQGTALEIRQANGQLKKLVVRQHGKLDLKQNPHIANDEFKLLQILKAQGLAVPTPYYFDQTPYLVIEYIEGETEFEPAHSNEFTSQLANQLFRIHQADFSKLDFLPQQELVYRTKFSNRPSLLDESLNEGSIRDILEAAWSFPQSNKSALLHGDFWLGNILWKNGQIAAVIDWEDANIGDPLADVANARLEILWALGNEAMQTFTDYYKTIANLDFTNLAYWDLCAALKPAFKLSEWAADELAEKRMRERHKLFVTHAFEKLTL